MTGRVSRRVGCGARCETEVRKRWMGRKFLVGVVGSMASPTNRRPQRRVFVFIFSKTDMEMNCVYIFLRQVE